MKKLSLAFALAGALSAGAAPAAEYAPHEFDFSELAIDGAAHGIVESVREVSRAQDDLFEHALKPHTAQELLVRIDDGRAVLLQPQEMRAFHAGQRVRVISSTTGTRVEHE
jgi:hypothetical protein